MQLLAGLSVCLTTTVSSSFQSAYEDEDLRDIRASMERLLQEEAGEGDFNGNPPEGEDQVLLNQIAAEINEENNQMVVGDDDDEEEEVGAQNFNINPPEGRDPELYYRVAVEINQDNNQMTVGDDDDDDDEDDDDDDDEEEEEECSNGSPGDEEAGELLSNRQGEENRCNNSQYNEEWHSGTSRSRVCTIKMFSAILI